MTEREDKPPRRDLRTGLDAKLGVGCFGGSTLLVRVGERWGGGCWSSMAALLRTSRLAVALLSSLFSAVDSVFDVSASCCRCSSCSFKRFSAEATRASWTMSASVGRAAVPWTGRVTVATLRRFHSTSGAASDILSEAQRLPYFSESCISSVRSMSDRLMANFRASRFGSPPAVVGGGRVARE